MRAGSRRAHLQPSPALWEAFCGPEAVESSFLAAPRAPRAETWVLSTLLIALQPGTSSGGPCLPTFVGPVHQPLTLQTPGQPGARPSCCTSTSEHAGRKCYFDFKLDLVAQSKQVAGISKRCLSLLRPHHCPGAGHPHGKERRRRMTGSGTALQADMLTSSPGPGPPLSDGGGSCPAVTLSWVLGCALQLHPKPRSL